MRIDDENKVVVPGFVAEYIEQHYDDKLPTSWDKADLLRDWDNYISVADRNDVAEWVRNADNFLKFVVAVATNNYIVEQPKKYYWRKKKEYLVWFEDRNYTFLNFDKFNKKVMLSTHTGLKLFNVLFTEQEAQELLKKDFYMFEKVECD